MNPRLDGPAHEPIALWGESGVAVPQAVQGAIADRVNAPVGAAILACGLAEAFADEMTLAPTYGGRDIPAIDAFEAERPCPDPNLAARILDATSSLSITQAVNPRERDNSGFSNADYPAGSIMAASGAVRASALLLLQYPRQSAGHGLRPEDLEWALPKDVSADLPARTAALQCLREIRTTSRNSIAWAEKDDSVVLVGYGIEFDDKRILWGAGKRTPQGYEIPKHQLPRLIDRLQATIVNPEGLREIARNAPPPPQKADLQREPSGRQVSLTASPIPDGYRIKYSEPFSPEGLAVKESLKRLGAGWDPDNKAWNLSSAAVKLLPTVLEDIPGVDVSKLPLQDSALSLDQRLTAEMIRDGLMPILATRGQRDEICIKTFARCEELFNANKTIPGVRWAGERNTYSLNLDAVPALINYLDQFEQIDQSSLLQVVEAVAKEKTLEVERIEHLAAAYERGVSLVTPSGKNLFPHQGSGAEFLLEPNGYGKILGDDRGLGKTATAIIAANTGFPGEKKLIVAPSSACLNWAQEVGLWLGPEEQAKVQVLDEGKDVIRPDAKWVVCTYALVAKMRGQLQQWAPTIGIYDEAHYLKEADSQRSIAVVGEDRKTFVGNRTKWVHEPGLADHIAHNWALTGTPIKNRPMELFNLLRLTKHPLGQNYFDFGVRFCDGHQVVVNRAGKERWDFQGASNLDELGDLIKPIFMQRLKRDTIDLPEKIETIVPVRIATRDQKTCQRGLEDFLSISREPGETGASFAIREIAEFTKLLHAAARANVPAALEIIQSALAEGQKIVVFSPYLDCLDQVQEEVGDVSVRLDGSMDKAARQAAIQRFQTDPSCKVFLGSLHACKEAITLTAASESLFIGASTVPGDNDQAADRIHRIGQTGTCNIRMLCAFGTLEEHLFAILAEKIRVIRAFETAAREGRQADPAILEAAKQTNVAREVIERLKAAAGDGKAKKSKKKSVAQQTPESGTLPSNVEVADA